MLFEELVADFGLRTGLGELEPDDERTVTLGAGEFLVTLVGDSTSRKAFVFAEIGELPLERREEFYGEALRANWIFQGGGGASLAINPESGRLALNRMLELDGMDGDSFFAMMAGFLDVLKKWRDLVAAWRGHVSEDSSDGRAATAEDGALGLMKFDRMV